MSIDYIPVTIDKDNLDFLMAFLFGTEADPYIAASQRAYRDLNRTLRLKTVSEERRRQLRHSVDLCLKEEVQALACRTDLTQDSYDAWHFSLCTTIRSIYQEAGIIFSYGQAQKWVNMTMKYLYILGVFDFSAIFPLLHIPLDSYIFTAVKEQFGIKPPVPTWSSMDLYEKQYLPYQRQLREKIVGVDPLRWEFRAWLYTAKDRADSQL